MRKAIATLSILIVIAAMPVMATDVTFSGEVDFGLGTNFTDAYGITVGDSDLELSANVDDFVSFTIGLDGLFPDKDGKVAGIGDLYMTIDMMKAFGLDSPVGFSFDVGYTSFDTQEYFSDLTGYEAVEVGYAENMTEAQLAGTFSYGSVNLLVAIGPTSFAIGKENLLVNLYGEFGGLKAEAYYIDTPDGVTGVSYTDAVGVGLSYDLMGDSMIMFGLGADYLIDKKDLEAGVAFGGSWNSFGYGVMGTGEALLTDAAFGMGIDLTYDIIDALQVYGAISTGDFTQFTKTLGYEAGVKVTTINDQVKFYLGWNDGPKYKTVVSSKQDDGSYIGNVYLRIVSEF
ncbi:MAG: hypothetical protein MI717_14130 [Spirochaetales bacterium]|nr:hypothetical protein [Spirochaetales bacterium]